MCATLLLLQTRIWSHWSDQILNETRTGRTRIVSLDPATACVLRDHSVPFESIEDCAPQQAWEETNAELHALLIQLADRNEQEMVETFSHYLISETNLIFDRILRIRALVERERPATLVIGATKSSEASNDLYDNIAHLPWPPTLQILRWDLQGPLTRI